MLNITDVRIKKIESENRLKGVASITIDNCFVVNEIRILESDKDRNLFIAMPSKKTEEGKFKDISHPINSETRNQIQEKILEAYRK